MEQIKSGDEPHQTAAEKMGSATEEEQQAMMAEFQKKFEEAEDQ